ncbi:MAG: transporter substrate-binding domain-containing protein [Bermanella sp.]
MSRLCIFIMVVLFSLPTLAEKIIAAGDPWPPFVDPDSPTLGIIVEITRAAYKTQNYEIEMKFVPWARAIDGVKEADYDVLLSAWYTKERAKFLYFSDPYLENKIKIIKRKGDSFEFNGLDSLTGKNVGVVRGYGYGDEFSNATNFNRPEGKNVMTNIKKLVSKRVDLTLEDEIVARAMMKKDSPDLLNKVEFSKKALSTNTVHVTSGLKNSRHKTIINAFNKGFKEIKSNGTLDAILKKYGI